MDQEMNASGETASVRWIVVIGNNKRMRLDLVALPASEAVVNSNPILLR